MPRLHIDVADKTCSAGSTIRGIVKLGGHEPVHVLSLQISLMGRSTTNSGFRSEFSTLQQEFKSILKEHEDLIDTPVTVYPGQFWGFDFIVPYHCTPQDDPDRLPHYGLLNARSGYANITQFRNYPEPRFDEEPVQKLPPTFWALTNYNCAFIMYSLNATLIAERPTSLPKIIQAWKPLKIVMARTPNDQIPQTSLLSEPGMPQLEGHETIPLSFSHKHVSTLADSFLELEYPTVGVAGDNLRLTLGISRDNQRDSTTPPDFLQRISVRLDTVISIKVSSVLSQKKKRSVIGKGKHLNKALYGRFELADVMALRLPPACPSTFAASNISRRHYLYLILAIESAQHRKRKFVRFQTGEVIVLPA